MNVRRHVVRIIQRSHPQEVDRVFGGGVIAPQGDAAIRAARKFLSLSAGRWQGFGHRRAFGHLHPVRFDQGIDGKGRAGFPLAPSAMTAMHEEGARCGPVAHRPAGAAAVEMA